MGEDCVQVLSRCPQPGLAIDDAPGERAPSVSTLIVYGIQALYQSCLLAWGVKGPRQLTRPQEGVDCVDVDRPDRVASRTWQLLQ
jgi:hypothetical protein